jgi:hypothetical protein
MKSEQAILPNPCLEEEVADLNKSHILCYVGYQMKITLSTGYTESARVTPRVSG